MCLDSDWVRKPVPGIVLDEKNRVFISWTETYCVHLKNYDPPSQNEEVVVEYDNNPFGSIDLAIFAWRFKDTKRYLVTWNKVNT